MSSEDKRLHPRYPVSWTGNIVVNFDTIDIHVGNICQQGMWFELPRPLAIGENYSVEVETPVEEGIKKIRAYLKVVYQNKSASGDYEVGAYLSLILPEDKPYFDQVIDQLSDDEEESDGSDGSNNSNEQRSVS